MLVADKGFELLQITFVLAVVAQRFGIDCNKFHSLLGFSFQTSLS